MCSAVATNVAFTMNAAQWCATNEEHQ